jgi:hypothetical protein
MKQCSYCGKEYPDDATECAIDATPFVEISPDTPEPAAPINLPRFGIFSERKIPVSLTLVSYLFFLTGAGSFAAVGALAFMAVFLAGGFGSNHVLIPCLIGGFLALLVVICLLMFPIVMLVAYAIVGVCFILYEGIMTGHGIEILSRLAGGGIAILFVYISRGLRMGSRGWRACALVFTWLQFIMLALGIVWHFQSQKHLQNQWVAMDWLEIAFGVIVLVWQYRVLIRPDVRDLFYNESASNQIE